MSAEAISGNCAALSFPLRVMSLTRVGVTKASARMPSYFGSNVQPVSVGISAPMLAYIGSRDSGERRRFTAVDCAGGVHAARGRKTNALQHTHGCDKRPVCGAFVVLDRRAVFSRSEERRVGKECRSRRAA